MVGNQQFTFLCSVTEVNVVQSWAQGKGEAAKPQLEFHRELAWQMMENTLNEPPVLEAPPVQCRPRRNVKHTHLKWMPFERAWDPHTHKFKIVMTDYIRLRCAGHTANVLLEAPGH